MKINNLHRFLKLLPITYCLLLIATTPSVLKAQGTIYGIKGGLAVGNQSYNDGGTSSNGLLFKPYGDFLIESAPADNSGVIYMQVGYHPRGHAQRFPSGVYSTPQGPVAFEGFTQEFVFHNIGLTVGFKKRNILNNPNAYYLLGLRAEYTVSNNLATASNSGGFYNPYALQSEYVKPFVYGLSLGGGYEFPFSELTGGFIEFSVHPDIGRQYYQPALSNVIVQQGQPNVSISEQSIRNLSFEITLGFRFLRKIEYID
jgi:hypothetical protein